MWCLVYNIYYENWFCVHTYKTDWWISDEETVLDKYGSVEELKKNIIIKKLILIMLFLIWILKIMMNINKISSYNFNKQIDNLCSNEKMVYDKNGNCLEFGDF